MAHPTSQIYYFFDFVLDSNFGFLTSNSVFKSGEILTLPQSYLYLLCD